MPYKIIKNKDKFQLINLKTNKPIKTLYKSKQTAASSAINFGNYRKEKLTLQGDKVM